MERSCVHYGERYSRFHSGSAVIRKGHGAANTQRHWRIFLFHVLPSFYRGYFERPAVNGTVLLFNPAHFIYGSESSPQAAQGNILQNYKP
jgi:hypothetical protein